MLRVVVMLTAALVIVFFVTQLIIPIWKDQRLFPVFRSKTRREKLEEELEKLEEFNEVLKLQRQVSQRLAATMDVEPLGSEQSISQRKELEQ